MLVSLSLLALGCAPDAPERFTGGGTHVDPPVDTATDSGGGDDTGGATGWTVTGVEAGFEDLPNIGTAIYTFIAMENLPGDLADTRIYVTLDGQDVEIDGELGVPVDDEYAWVTPDQELFTALQVGEPGSYEMSLYLKTGAGEVSNTWSGTVDSANERDLPAKP